MDEEVKATIREAQDILNEKRMITREELVEELDIEERDASRILPSLTKITSQREKNRYYLKAFFDEKTREVEELIQKRRKATFEVLQRETDISEEMLLDILSYLDVVTVGTGKEGLYCSKEFWERKKDKIKNVFKSEVEREAQFRKIGEILEVPRKYAKNLASEEIIKDIGFTAAREKERKGEKAQARRILDDVLKVDSLSTGETEEERDVLWLPSSFVGFWGKLCAIEIFLPWFLILVGILNGIMVGKVMMGGLSGIAIASLSYFGFLPFLGILMYYYLARFLLDLLGGGFRMLFWAGFTMATLFSITFFIFIIAKSYSSFSIFPERETL